MEKNNISLIVVLILVSFLGGYWFGGSKTTDVKTNVPSGMHVMPDGSLMGDMNMMSMEDMMISMNAQLKGKTGDEFDVAFLQEMIIHHEGAVEMAKLALTNAKMQEIKDLAEAIILTQNKEIGDMRMWLRDSYNQ